MSHKKYRICLLMVAVAATVGGIFYYCFCLKDDGSQEKGMLVKQMQEKGSRLKEAGKQVGEDVKQALSKTGSEVKEAVQMTGESMKEQRKQ